MRLLNWINGWRYDLDGWLVRARRASDPYITNSAIGFTEEACIAVRTHEQARAIDRCAALSGKGEAS